MLFECNNPGNQVFHILVKLSFVKICLPVICTLVVTIQSLWHLRRFREQFLKMSSAHVHVGNPCVVCALYDIFLDLRKAFDDGPNDAVAPTSLRIALSNLYPDSKFFQEVIIA